MFIGGIVLLVIGVLMIAGGYALNAMGTTQTVPSGAVLQLSPQTVGSASVTITYSGAGSGATIYLVTGTPTCSNPAGVVAQGSGDSGSFSATLSAGTTYSVYGCNDGNGVTITDAAVGLTYLIIIGIVLAVVGAVLLVMGRRGGPKTEPAPEMAPP